MDKQRARFILQCFRPDGADAGEPDFTAALGMAAQDRELGEWLARERAHDAAFAEALGRLPIPSGLRDEILACFAAARGDLPELADATDAAFIGALAALRPPDGLRGQILAAMERSAAASRPARWWWRLGVPLAAAAAVALGLFVWRDQAPPAAGRLAAAPADGPLPVAAVEAGFLKAFADPTFRLDLQNADHKALFQHLRSRSLPCPCPRTLPPGLANVEGIGCRVLEIDGHRGSLVCFDQRQAGVVHLVVFFRREVADPLPATGSPAFEQHGGWAVAQWAHDERVFMLLGEAPVSRLAALF